MSPLREHLKEIHAKRGYGKNGVADFSIKTAARRL
jgi:hypothetical protein